jgi:hypothetical protein
MSIKVTIATFILTGRRMLLLKEAVRQLQDHFSKTPPAKWVRDEPTQEDIQHILKEGYETSKFDPLQLRKQMTEDLQHGLAELVCKRCQYGKLLVIVHPEWKRSIPWQLFGEILRAFSGKQWRIVIFANPSERLYPTDGKEPTSEHINGGYAYPGNPRSVVIYRLEECARVLVHELLHAAGTDTMTNNESLRETLTESWAEVFLIAIQSKGSVRKAAALWKDQSQWIVDQEYRLVQEFGVTSSANYAYRYTVARRHMLEGWGFSFPFIVNPSTSLRFTAPSLTFD